MAEMMRARQMPNQQPYLGSLSQLLGLVGQGVGGATTAGGLFGVSDALQSETAQQQYNAQLYHQLMAMQNAYPPAPPSPLAIVLDEIIEERTMMAKLGGYEAYRKHRWG